MSGTHILSATDLSPVELARLFLRAKTFKEGAGSQKLRGKILASVFYEPSTRTRFSFEAAMMRLGGANMSMDNAQAFSSAAKGESLTDAIRVISGYADVIVLRHSENGSARTAAMASSVPLINGGDGTNEHPTQAYLDLFTIWEASWVRFPSSELNVLFFGDNKRSRTVNSLARLLATHTEPLGFTVQSITFVGPEGVASPQEQTLELLTKAGIRTKITDESTDQYDVVYVTRSQRERALEGVGASVMIYEPDQTLPAHAIIMHPLPRTQELPPALDGDSRARYFQQANNGLYVRMALLEFVVAD